MLSVLTWFIHFVETNSCNFEAIKMFARLLLVWSSCVKYPRTQVFSDPYFPVWWQNLVKITQTIRRQFCVRPNSALYEKIIVRENPCSSIFCAVHKKKNYLKKAHLKKKDFVVRIEFAGPLQVSFEAYSLPCLSTAGLLKRDAIENQKLP